MNGSLPPNFGTLSVLRLIIVVSLGSLSSSVLLFLLIPRKSYGLIEIKLGGDRLIEEGAKSLRSMEAKIDIDKMNAPSFLMVLTGTGDYAYRRQDGVYVVPIGCLKN